MLRVISWKLYIVLSAYKLSLSKASVTSSRVVPWYSVFAKIVCIDPILVSYSLRPDLTGSIVKDLTILFPALMAEFVILARAVTPTTCNAENLAFTLSTALPSSDILTRLVAVPTSSSPFEAPVKLRLLLSFSSVDMEVATLDSNCLLSNRISTTFSSIVVLIL